MPQKCSSSYFVKISLTRTLLFALALVDGSFLCRRLFYTDIKKYRQNTDG